MKIIIVVATSLDGFIAKDSNSRPDSWTSPEDQKMFKDLINQHKLQVFGKNTYLAYKPTPSPHILRVVLTKSPSEFHAQTVPGQLEFESLTPIQFIKKYEDMYDSCLVLGGSFVYNQFMKAGLVNEIYQTVEPVELRSGIPFLQDGKKLQDYVGSIQPEITKLNKTGTILKHYILKHYIL